MNRNEYCSLRMWAWVFWGCLAFYTLAGVLALIFLT